MEILQEQLQDLNQLFKKLPQIVAVYLYGSRVSKRELPKSDLDVAVIAESIESIDYGKLYFAVSQIIKDYEIDLRIITKKTAPTFIFEVIKTARCIYQRSDTEKVQFETKALSEYYDSEHLRKIYDSYLKAFFERV